MKQFEENMPPSGSQGELQRARVRALQDAVLLHLRDNGSMKWIDLYLQFNEDGSGEIGPALGLLARLKHIAVEFDGTTTITAAGRERLM
jgi:hypothetical protein